MDDVYDKVYIGSGPINVIDAYLHSERGDKVALIDAGGQIGGAWVAIPVGEYGNLEIGCHIWSYNKKVYRFLTSFLDLDMVNMRPQPYILKGNRKMIYDHKSLYLTPKYILKQVFYGDFKAAGNFLLRRHPAARMPIIPRAYRYPKGGAREFQDKLKSLIGDSKVTVKLNTKAVELNYTDDNWEIIDKDGIILRSKNVVLTATSNIERITYDNKLLELNHSYITYSHFHLIVSGDLLKPISYIRVLNNSHIHRISDITNQLSQSRKNETVLLVGVFDKTISEWGSDEQIAEKILAFLVEKGYLAKSNELVNFQKNRFPTAYINGQQHQLINNLDPSIELISTTDLVYGFYTQLKKWKSKNLLDQNSKKDISPAFGQ
ncbi:MAG: NAD(P)/FAD-dependent oxidoreductase [Crocinitomicaceae bacterium]|nr:NAD(P)/FAD-dependent oxidoreductase [Crocinitomicaceae bacterium]